MSEHVLQWHIYVGVVCCLSAKQMVVLAQYQIVTVLVHFILVIYLAIMLPSVSKYYIINALVQDLMLVPGLQVKSPGEAIMTVQ
jgi:hypothetical protein